MSSAAWPYLLFVAILMTICSQIYRDLRRRHMLGRFAGVLDPENRRWLERLALSATTSQAVVNDATQEAHALWAEDPQAARDRLRLACEHVERVTTPRFFETVAFLRRMARSVKVFPPPRPLAVAAYQLLRTRGWAVVAALLHWLATTGRARVRVRVWFLKRGFVVAARTFTGTAVLAIEQGFGRPWYPTLAAAAHDLKLMEDETVVTAEHVLTAFARWQASRQND